jgi:hypothetical protein
MKTYDCSYEKKLWQSSVLGNRKETDYTFQQREIEKNNRQRYLQCVSKMRGGSLRGGQRSLRNRGSVRGGLVKGGLINVKGGLNGGLKGENEFIFHGGRNVGLRGGSKYKSKYKSRRLGSKRPSSRRR